MEATLPGRAGPGAFSVKVLLDTSTLVAALVRTRPRHQDARPRLSRAKAGTLDLAGGVVHVALIARAAEGAHVDRLVTLNAAGFRRAWPQGAEHRCPLNRSAPAAGVLR